MPDEKDVTGRDSYIIARALYEAIRVLEDSSDRDDMRAVLDAKYSGFAQSFTQTEAHVRRYQTGSNLREVPPDDKS